MPKSIVCIRNLSKTFDDNQVLKNINLNLEIGDFVTLMGYSGSGKTTLLNIIGMLDDKYDGDYFFADEEVKSIKNKASFRSSKIGYVFQSYYLIDYLTVLENILLPFNYCNEKPDMDYINQFISELELTSIMSKKVNVLSGGEKQRIAIARALSRRPSLLICDEPTGNLDAKNRDRVLKILKSINKKTSTVVLIVTHDSYMAKSGSKKFVLENGELYEN